jgi:membrane protein implicated in regulation of membrane protease activity
VQNDAVILLIGIGLAIFVVPWPWNIPIVILFGLIEIAETSWAWRWVRHADDTRGPKTVIGATGRAVTDCRPSGTVRVHATMWPAECAIGVDGGQRIRVLAQVEQTLIVEPVD